MHCICQLFCTKPFQRLLSIHISDASTSCTLLPLLTIAAFTLSLHLTLGLPTLLLPSGIHSRYLLGTLCSSILLTWPYHRSCALSTISTTPLTPKSALTSSFLFLSLLVTPLINLKTRISHASNLLFALVLRAQASCPYISIGLNMLVYITILTRLEIALSFNNGNNIAVVPLNFPILLFNSNIVSFSSP